MLVVLVLGPFLVVSLNGQPSNLSVPACAEGQVGVVGLVGPGMPHVTIVEDDERKNFGEITSRQFLLESSYNITSSGRAS